MKRYLVFSGHHYYPAGGWGDFQNSFATVEEAKRCFMEYGDWADIVDTETETVILTRDGDKVKETIK